MPALISGSTCGSLATGILLILLAATQKLHAQPVLLGDTSAPRHSLFLADEDVVLKFRVRGLPRESDEVLEVKITDIDSKVVYERRVPLTVGKGEFSATGFSPGSDEAPAEWLIDLSIPYKRLGYYQADVRLTSGATLPSVGSRPGGYLTYAIILDPAQRRSYPARETFFGMIGAFEPALIGASWYVHNYTAYTWKSFEPDRPEQFWEHMALFEAEEQRGGWVTMPHFEGHHHYNIAGRRGHIPQYSILYFGTPPFWAADNETRGHLTAALTRDGEEHFRQFCLKLGRYIAEKRANEALHYYQVTDEPDIPWGYKGSIESLVRLYEIAYPTLHAVDPQAVVAGPGINIGAHKQLEEMLQCGFGRYIDVLDFHPYMGGDVLPAEFGLIEKIRIVKELMHKYIGRELLLTGTESGHNAQGDTMDIWLRKAWADIHHNLILLGEGFWLNVAFHGGDQSRKPNENTWGYFFNLDLERDYGIQKASPKPVVPAYTTLSYLLEGHKSTGAIEWLGKGVVGYAYERDGKVTLALWSHTPIEIMVPTGVPQVQIYDWMGNANEQEAPGNMLTLTTRRDPQYIRGVSATFWGSKATDRPLRLKERMVTALPGARVAIECEVAGVNTELKSATLLFNAFGLPDVAPQQQTIRLSGGRGKGEQITFDLPTATKPGRYTLSLRLQSGAATLDGASVTLQVDPLVTMTQVIPTINKQNQIGVSARLQASPQRATQGEFKVAPKSTTLATQSIAFNLKASESQSLTALWEPTGEAPYRIAAASEVVTAEGIVATNTIDFNFIALPYLAQAPVIDGQPREWSTLPGITSINAKIIGRGLTSGAVRLITVELSSWPGTSGRST